MSHRISSKPLFTGMMLLVAVAGVPAPVAASSHKTAAAKEVPLTADEKLLQVLNRLTYGPRPGDLEHLRAVGIKAWLKQQLHPETIADSALEARLTRYPAMQLSLPELMALYPNQQVVRKVMTGRAEQPGGAAEKAIYNNLEARLQQKAANKTNTSAAPVDNPAPVLPPDTAETLFAMPPTRRFSALCSFDSDQMKVLRQSLKPADRQRLVNGFTPKQLEAVAAFASPQGLVAAEDIQTKLLRDLYSERQLNEVMTDFWVNHFNVYIKKSHEAPYYISTYVRDTIRPHALGNFEALLDATAGSPAMLSYLDNATSIGPNSLVAQRDALHGKHQTGLNENYARELMELHTLGVNGGYTQKDVSEVAKVFTGWTIASPERGGILSQARFDETKHEPGPKTVLGVTIRENGEKEGLQVLHLLATSPQTARFISTKLAVRFIADDPPKPVVDRMTKTFLSSHGDIRKVLLAMVNSPEFFSRASFREKVKTPQDFVVSAVRASGAAVQSPGALTSVIEDLGMPVYGMQTPNGYSMKADAWNSTASLVQRLNFALALAANRVVGVDTNWSTFYAHPPVIAKGTQAQAAFKERALEAALLHESVSDRTRATILAQMTVDPAAQEASLKQIAVKDRKRDPFATDQQLEKTAISDPQGALAAGLLFGSPEFQRR